MTEERYLSDEEISNSYKRYRINSVQLRDTMSSGWIDIEFDDNESRVDAFFINDEGRISFDSWYPDWLYEELVDFIYNKFDEQIKIDGLNPPKAVSEFSGSLENFIRKRPQEILINNRHLKILAMECKLGPIINITYLPDKNGLVISGLNSCIELNEKLKVVRSFTPIYMLEKDYHNV